MNKIVEQDDVAVIPANAYSAGTKMTFYRAKGFFGNATKKEHLVRGGICTETYYQCGKETVSLASNTMLTLKKGKTSTPEYFYQAPSVVDSWFKVDTSASDAYSGCATATYSFTTSTGGSVNVNNYVEYDSTTGLKWKLGYSATDQDIYL